MVFLKLLLLVEAEGWPEIVSEITDMNRSDTNSHKNYI